MAVIKSIKSANPDAVALKAVIEKVRGVKPAESRALARSTATSADVFADLKRRVRDLENQVRYLMEKVDQIELRGVARGQSSVDAYPRVKEIVLSYLKKGQSASVDELLERTTLKDLPWDVVKEGLETIVDEELLNVSQGKSDRKIGWNHGRLIRP
ncbi:MAG: hypothetical protein Kow0069_16110 [Promethearchaeota archaeon]